MLCVPFFAEINVKKNRNKGTINVLQGGEGGLAEYGRLSMVKYHMFTFFLGPLVPFPPLPFVMFFTSLGWIHYSFIGKEGCTVLY